VASVEELGLIAKAEEFESRISAIEKELKEFISHQPNRSLDEFLAKEESPAEESEGIEA
jgi:hypothetical protein